MESGWNDHAVLLEREGRWVEAVLEYRRLFERAISRREPGAALDALYSQARALRGGGREEESEEMALLCRCIAVRLGEDRVAARSVHLLAVLRFTAGDLDAAERLYLDALDRARDAGDDALIGFTCQNLGVIANVRGELHEARLRYLESVGASVRAEDPVSSVMVYNNLGMVCTDLGEHLEAEVYFDRGIEIAERLSDVPMLARLHANRAEPLIGMGDLDRASEALARAERLALPIEASPTLADISRFRGVVARERGSFAEAGSHLAESIRIAESRALPLSRAEALEERAGLNLRRGRAGAARRDLLGALESYRAVRAARDAARVENLLDQLAPAV